MAKANDDATGSAKDKVLQQVNSHGERHTNTDDEQIGNRKIEQQYVGNSSHATMSQQGDHHQSVASETSSHDECPKADSKVVGVHRRLQNAEADVTVVH